MTGQSPQPQFYLPGMYLTLRNNPVHLKGSALEPGTSWQQLGGQEETAPGHKCGQQKPWPQLLEPYTILHLQHWLPTASPDWAGVSCKQSLGCESGPRTVPEPELQDAEMVVVGRNLLCIHSLSRVPQEGLLARTMGMLGHKEQVYVQAISEERAAGQALPTSKSAWPPC